MKYDIRQSFYWGIRWLHIGDDLSLVCGLGEGCATE